MPIQFYMRGYNTTTSQYVDWVVNDQPDSTGAYSGYNPGDLTNITINRLVTSKVDNFLKPSTPDYLNINTIDGPYLFHLNSYDWLHPNASPLDPPIPPPTNLIGIAVNRGTADNNFPEPTPNDYASLVWSEIASSWAFAFIDPLGGLSDTARMLSGSMTIIDAIDSYLQIFNSSNTAQSGIIRLPNNTGIFSRDFADSSDYMLIGTDTNDRVVLANSSIDVYLPGSQLIDGSIKETVSGDTTNTATTGFIRLQSETAGITFKASTSMSDSYIISTDNLDTLYIGDENNTNVVYTTETFGGHLFQMGNYINFAITPIGVYFNSDVYNPIISQAPQSVGNGQTFSLLAQDTIDVTGNGGYIVIGSGSGPVADGVVDLQIATAPKLRVYGSTTPAGISPAENSALNPDSIVLYNPSLRFYNNLSFAKISFDPIDLAAGNANMFTIAGQDNIGIGGTAGDLEIVAGSATGINSAGGNLYLVAGTGTDYNGTILFAVGSNPVAAITDNKFISAKGISKNITTVDSNYNIFDSDDLVMVDLSVYAVPITVYLSATPGFGDTYTVKDKAGLSNVNSITIDANGSTIDGSATATLNTAYASITVVYNGTSWSAI